MKILGSGESQVLNYCMGETLFAIVKFFADPKNGTLENK